MGLFSYVGARCTKGGGGEEGKELMSEDWNSAIRYLRLLLAG